MRFQTVAGGRRGTRGREREKDISEIQTRGCAIRESVFTIIVCIENFVENELKSSVKISQIRDIYVAYRTYWHIGIQTNSLSLNKMHIPNE